MRRNDVASTSFRRRVPIRFLINQCQIITFLILKYDIIENSRIELRGIVLPVQMGGLLGGAKGYVGPPSQIIGGGLPPLAPPPSSYAYAMTLQGHWRPTDCFATIAFHLVLYSCSNCASKVHPCPLFNPIALRKAKIVYNFGLSECNRVNVIFQSLFLSKPEDFEMWQNCPSFHSLIMFRNFSCSPMAASIYLPKSSLYVLGPSTRYSFEY